jgi:hypothetical protein
MVRAVLDGRKTETRRVMKLKTRPWERYYEESGCCQSDWTPTPGEQLHPDQAPDWWWVTTCHADYLIGRCPFGVAGDRLWVRETWCCASPTEVVYRADGEMADHFPEDHNEGKWRPSIHMPRWASRITLEVTEVRVERLQDKLNGKRASWESNPWVWVVSFEVADKAGGKG